MTRKPKTNLALPHLLPWKNNREAVQYATKAGFATNGDKAYCFCNDHEFVERVQRHNVCNGCAAFFCGDCDGYDAKAFYPGSTPRLQWNSHMYSCGTCDLNFCGACRPEFVVCSVERKGGCANVHHCANNSCFRHLDELRRGELTNFECADA